ncbi:Pre-rRNA-processing protein TSR2-domain-containing protein [Mycena floridula]|nr:Pre-rRNA-processing protein TSR2-domain-containing protein [Mycena floridula]
MATPNSVLFARGVIARLATWPTLRLAIQEGWGGPGGSQKRTWLASTIVDAFEETVPTPDDQYIEEMLLQVMSDEFDAQLEDDSAEGVASDIVKVWDETRSGKLDLVLKLEELADRVKGTKTEALYAPSQDDENEREDDDGDGSSDEEMLDADEAPQLLEPKPRNEPEVDEDGFTMVKGKGKGRP